MPAFDGAYLLMIFSAWAAGALGAWALADMIAKARAARQRSLSEIIVTETKSPFLRLFLPTARGIGMSLRASLGGSGESGPGIFDTYLRRTGERLASAGNPEGINAEEYCGFFVLCATIGCFLGWAAFLTLGSAEMGWEIFVLTGLIIGCVRMPMWLGRCLTIRHTRIRRELPFSLDLLTLAMEAGLDFTSALDRICRKLGSSPLGEEFQNMLREIRLGKSRSNAMRDLGRRVGVSEVQSVMTSLVQAEEMGSSIGPILRIQAEQQRERRSQRAEETAGKAPVKMIFPLLLFVGVVFLIIFGPMLLSFFL